MNSVSTEKQNIINCSLVVSSLIFVINAFHILFSLFQGLHHSLMPKGTLKITSKLKGLFSKF